MFFNALKTACCCSNVSCKFKPHNVNQMLTTTTVRPWPNDQTLLVKHLKFASQEMFGLRPRHKTLPHKQK